MRTLAYKNDIASERPNPKECEKQRKPLGGGECSMRTLCYKLVARATNL